MKAKVGGMRATISSLPKLTADEPKPSRMDEDGRDLKRQTLYLPLGVHDQLREAAFSKRISMQKIVRQALDMWFADEGLPSWDEAKKQAQTKVERAKSLYNARSLTV